MILSPSQIDAAEDCLRKWAWDKIARVPRPTSPSAALGTLVHAQIERYLKFRQPLDLLTPEGQIAHTGSHLWPTNVRLENVERPFTLDLEGLKFRGVIDLWHDHPKVTDHKSTSDFKWAKTPEILKRDPQGVVYGLHAMREYGTDAVELEWIYYRTKEPYRKPAMPVRATVTYRDILPGIERIHRTGETLVRLAERKAHPLSLPFSASSCEKYGGCAYKGLCNLSPLERLEAHMTQPASMAEAIAKLTGAVNPGAPPAPAPVPVAAPPGVTLSPDGKYYLTPENTWAPYPPPAPVVAPPPPPAPPTDPANANTAAPAEPAKPKRGRPVGSTNREKPAPGETDALETSFLDGMATALEGLDAMGRAFAARFFRG